MFNENVNKLAAPRKASPFASICGANTDPRSRKSGYGLLLGCRSRLDGEPFKKTFFWRFWTQKIGQVFTVCSGITPKLASQWPASWGIYKYDPPVFWRKRCLLYWKTGAGQMKSFSWRGELVLLLLLRYIFFMYIINYVKPLAYLNICITGLGGGLGLWATTLEI